MLKLIGKRVLTLVLVVVMLLGFAPAIQWETSDGARHTLEDPLTLNAYAADVTSGSGTWISNKLTYSYSVATSSDNTSDAAGSVSASGNTLTVKATSAKEYETGGCDSKTVSAAATTTTVTVTNASSYPLKFNTLTTGGEASVAGVSQGDTIASGATFTITVTSPANGTSATEKSGTVTVSVSEETSVTITLNPSPYVSYTVNGKTVAQNGSSQTFTVDAGTTISLPSITAPSGYEFKGWRVGSSITTASSFTADAGYTVFPVIVTAGTDFTAANFKVGSTTYTFWEDAVSAAVSGGGTMFVNLEEVTLPSNVLDNLLPASGGTYVKPSGGGVEYILPAGVTLVLPYSTSTTVHTTTPAYGYKARVTPSPFRTLTVPNGVKITVNGSVSVDSYVCAYGQSNQGNGTPSGPHGKIVMKSGSEMTFNSGANLYCWGYINGDGNIYMKSGAKVYECFQFCDWRGGWGTNAINENSQRVFPMSQYYVQNVEAPMRIYKGATEYVWSVVNMNSDTYPVSALEFIGANGMFTLTGGSSDYVTKRFHANVDQLEIAAHGDMSLNNLTVKVDGLPVIGTITMNSRDYVLPINNMNIVVETGTTSIASSQTYGIAFLPSSKLTVNEGATFSVNAPVYFYDAEDWGGYVGASNLKLVVSGYSTANGTTTMRTADNLKDAELNVNGTVTVGNKLYTTEHGAHITSSAGTGVINFTTACATSTATTYQGTQSGSSTSTKITYTSITVNNAWLLNGDESYSQTVGTGTSTWSYDKPGEHWYRFLVDFNYNGNTIKRDYYCENNDTVTYDASWLANLGATASNGTAAIDGTNVSVTGVTANSTVTLTGTPAEYMPTFVLSEEEYTKHYLLYGGTEITNTTTINGDTYYIVDQADSALAVGTSYAAPTDASMGVTAANHNSIVWNLSGLSYTSGDPYRGTVPAGAVAQGPAYIYGFYDGVVAYNSWNDTYYKTLIGAFEVLPQDVSATITLLADCGTFEEESGTTAYATYTANNITLDLNGHHAVGRIVNAGTFTLELNGGTLDFHTGDAAAVAGHNGLATIINSGTMTVQDSVGGGEITTDAIASSSGTSGTAVIRNNAGATLTVTGKDADHLLPLSHTQNVNSYNYGIFNLGTINALTNVDISTENSGTTGLNVYNYNTGVITSISGGHMFCANNCSIFNYGGTITTIDGLTIDGKNGIVNRNIRGGAIASGYTVAEADKGVIGTITNCHIEVGQYAINNNAVINTVSGCTLIAHPDTAQCDTRGNGLATASEGNVAAYTVFNSANWWYDTNVWKQVDSSSGGYTRVNYYKEEEEYRPYIGQIVDCEIYAENTTTSASYGDYPLVNYGVIGKIGGTTNIKTYKHPDSTATITTSHYGLHNLSGGIIKSIEGTVNVSATGIGTVYNDGVFTTQVNYTYANKVGGNVTYQYSTYGEPSTIQSITCAGTWSCGSYYCLMNSGYIGTINAPNLTLQGNTSSYNVLYNTTGGANSTYEYTCEYTDGATASTAYHRTALYTKNLEKGSTIGTLNGITVIGKYQVLNNQGHIGTLSNVSVSNNANSNDPTFLNGDSRYATVYEDRKNVASYAEDNPHVTISAGYATRYDREYTYSTPTIDTIDNLTVTSTGQYAFRNAGHVGTLKNSTLTASTNCALHNSASGPYTERQTLQYYSGTSVFATTKYPSEYSKHYKRNPATIDTIDNCTIQTTSSTYAALNVGHIGTIKNSTFHAGTTTASAYALANVNSQEREYTRDGLEDIMYITANGGTACTAYFGTGGETDVVVYDYDAPGIDLIGEGNTFIATTTVIANTGVITAINSGTGTPTTITASAQKGSAIYNYSACLDARTTTTPYTAAASASASGTKGTAVNSDTLLSGASIGTIKNVYIDANGYGILNGDETTGKLPTIGEIGGGTEIYAHCGTKAYSAIRNKVNAKITTITGGIFKTTAPATTYAYYSTNTDSSQATLISGGYFVGNAVKRATAIYQPDDTTYQTYPTGKKLSTGTTDPTEVNANMSGTYFYIADTYKVTFNMQGHGTDQKPEDQTVEFGQKATAPTAPAANAIVREDTDGGKLYRFDGWYKEAGCTNEFDFDKAITSENFTVTDDRKVIAYAKWTEVPAVAQIVATKYASLADAVAAAQNGDTITMLANEELSALVAIEGKNITLDLNGHTVSKSTGSALQVKGTGALTLTDSSDSNTGVVQATGANAKESDAVVVLAGGSFTLKSGTIRSNTYGISILGNATVTGGTVIGDTDVLYKANGASGTFAVSGGWFSHAVNSDYCAPGYHPITDTTHTPQYTVSNLYTVTWKNGDTVLETDEDVEYGATPTYNSATPAKEADAQYTYTFAGWAATDGGDVIANLPNVAADVTYYAAFSKTTRTYTVTWKNGDTVLETDENVEYGATPTYDGETPAKETTEQYTYTFNGWSPEVAAVTGDTVYTAQFESTVRTYTITWQNDDGTTIDTTTVAYDVLPTHADPTKAADAQYTYTFAGWTPTVEKVTGPATYKATFTKTLKSYTVHFDVMSHGAAPDDQTVNYGGKATEPTAPTADGYTFGGWYKESACTTAWDFANDTVMKDTTLYAKWAANLTVKISYKLWTDDTFTKESGSDTTTPTFTYSLGDGLTDPQYVYCTFAKWTYYGEDKTSSQLSDALDNLLKDGPVNNEIEVTANFIRDSYYLNVYAWMTDLQDGRPDSDENNRLARSGKRYLGYATQISGPATKTVEGNAYPFQYWLVGKAGDDLENYERVDTQKLIYFPTERGEYNAIMCYGTGNGAEENSVSFRILNETTEKAGNLWRAVVTIELTGPKGEFEVASNGVGINYFVTDKVRDAEGNVVNGKYYDDNGDAVVLSASDLQVGEKGSAEIFNDLMYAINEGGSGGIYTVRIPLQSEESNFFTYAFVKYTYNGTEYIKYATRSGVVSNSPDAYDTISNE